MPYKNNQPIPSGDFCEISTRRNGKKVACKHCNTSTHYCEKYDELLKLEFRLVNHFDQMTLGKCAACKNA